MIGAPARRERRRAVSRNRGAAPRHFFIFKGLAMSNRGIQQGELAYWLSVLTTPDEASGPVPEHIAEALRVLRCVEDTEDGGLRVTDKGLLALRMADPAAIHHR
jgi:hypothetical protein